MNENVWWLASRGVWSLYAVAPVIAVGLAWRRSRKTGARTPMVIVLLAGLWGLILGGGLAAIYGWALEARPSVVQVLKIAWVMWAVLMILRWVQWGLDAVVRAVVARVSGFLKPLLWVLGTAGRTLVLFALILPFLMALLMVYRPKVVSRETPQTLAGRDYMPVVFDAADGLAVSAWWVPAAGDGERSTQTVVVCHGLGSNKANQFHLGEPAMQGGWNVLAIDLRAHGESGGQVTTFGVRERFDVLGAVRWLREAHPRRATRIFGVGASMGAAAIVAAAAEDSDDGRSIDGVAVFGSFDDLGTLSRRTINSNFPVPLSTLLRAIALPAANLHAGTDLQRFRPAEAIARLWPRPVMVVHGVDDEVIPFNHGLRLYNAAGVPKTPVWIHGAGHNDVIDNDQARRLLVEFLDTARPTL